jgi:hypothetical protein
MSHSLRDNVKSQFVEGVEYTPWGPFIEAMLNGGSMQDSEVKRLYEGKHLSLKLLSYKLEDSLLTGSRSVATGALPTKAT